MSRINIVMIQCVARKTVILFKFYWTVVIGPIFFIFSSVICLIPCHVEYCCKICEYCCGFDGCQTCSLNGLGEPCSIHSNCTSNEHCCIPNPRQQSHLQEEQELHLLNLREMPCKSFNQRLPNHNDDPTSPLLNPRESPMSPYLPATLPIFKQDVPSSFVLKPKLFNRIDRSDVTALYIR